MLSGRTGRLYKGLVEGRKVANEASAGSDSKKYAGRIEIEAVVKDGQDPAAVEKALDEEIARLKEQPLPAEELQKVKNQAKAGAYRRLSSPFFIAIQLLVYEGLGDWRYCQTRPEDNPQRQACDYLMTGTAKDTGRWGPTWKVDGRPCDGTGACANHADNQFKAIAKDAGVFEACASELVPVYQGADDPGTRCGEVFVNITK